MAASESTDPVLVGLGDDEGDCPALAGVEVAIARDVGEGVVLAPPGFPAQPPTSRAAATTQVIRWKCPTADRSLDAISVRSLQREARTSRYVSHGTPVLR